MFIKENVINVNLGLEKEYKLLQISDTHLSLISDEDTLDEITHAKKMEEEWFRIRVDFAKHFNEEYDENLLPSKECLTNLITYAKNENPDCLLLTGDIIDYYSDSNYKYVVNLLTDLPFSYLYCCGNHETPRKSFNLLCHDEIEMVDFKEFYVVSLDNSKKEFSLKQLEFIRNLTKENKPIILAMHIPVITKYNEDEMKMYDEYFAIRYSDTNQISKEFINLITNDSTIKCIFCGHTHGYSVSEFAVNKMQYIASSGLIGFINKIIIK